MKDKLLEAMAEAYRKAGAREGVHIDQECCEGRMQAALTAIQASEDVVLVPRVATVDMVRAAWKREPYHPSPKDAYTAMIEAGSIL